MEETTKADIYTDGATVGHNGKLGTVKEVGLGVYINVKDTIKLKTNKDSIMNLVEKREVKCSERALGKSNNEAEFKALILAMELCEMMGINHCLFHLDSQIVTNRANGKRPSGKYQNTRMDNFQNEVLDLAEKFENIEFKWIPREENTIADKLSKDACKLVIKK